MRQSNFITGALFIAFVVYVTVKGELGKYLGFLGLGSASAAIPAAGTGGINPLSIVPPVQSLFGQGGVSLPYGIGAGPSGGGGFQT